MGIWRSLESCGLRTPGAARAALRGAFLALICLSGAMAGGEPAPRHTNRLIDSADPYLLLHAHNPVDWYPWGEEALEKARRENKPIFLSVGYSTCYWCHVAEQTLYSDPKIAALMNQWFVNVKVDREERPDLDGIYMLATQLIAGHGGWPNNVFMTPELKPFFAGSYFPPDDQPGRPGFATILRAAHEDWVRDPKAVREKAERVFQAMQRVSAGAPTAGPQGNPAAWLAQARDALLQSEDPLQGGFGHAGPKFPRTPSLAMLLADYRLNRNAAALGALTRTLDAMAHGGVYDHLAGGFHRYSTEPGWSIPHFEKMLYDNAQLLRLYAEAGEATGSALYRRVALETAHYLGERMMAADGGFYTAEDAAVGRKEGATYLWTHGQIDAALGPRDAARFFRLYVLAPMPPQPLETTPAEEGEGVLRVRLPSADREERARESLAASLRPLRTKLLAARDRRPQPARDEKMVVALNGLAIDALARSGRILGEPRHIAWAKRAAARLWALAFDARTHTLKHQVFRGRAAGAAYLDDYALLGVGLLSLAEATGEPHWRERALLLADALLRLFRRPDGSLAMSAKDGKLPLAPREGGDSSYPSGTSAAVELLLRLSSQQPEYAEAVPAVVRQLGAGSGGPKAWPAMISALNTYGAAAKLVQQKDGADSLDTAAHVKAAARIVPGGQDEDRIEITLAIEPGYHVNANPATYPYLVPTSVSFKGAAPEEVRYPKAVRFKPQFAAEGIDVYEGSVLITAGFGKGSLQRAKSVEALVRVQACNDRVCLPPATLTVSAR